MDSSATAIAAPASSAATNAFCWPSQPQTTVSASANDCAYVALAAGPVAPYSLTLPIPLGHQYGRNQQTLLKHDGVFQDCASRGNLRADANSISNATRFSTNIYSSKLMVLFTA